MRWDGYITMTVAIGLTALFGLLFFGPNRRDFQALRASTRSAKDQLTGTYNAVARLSELKASNKQENNLLADYHTCITSSADLGRFVEDVSAIADRLGLGDRKIVPLAPQTLGRVMVLPIRISFVSGFGASFDFLREVERLPRAVRIMEFVVERVTPDYKAGDGEESELRTELAVQIFYEST